MDKLKPVLKQIFWILFGIALLIPVIGWFLGTGTMAEAIETRIATLSGLNPTPGATVPNDSWIEQVSKIKGEREERLETASDFLWEQQQQYMTWPRRMQPEIEDRMFEEAIEVRGLETYRRGFNDQVDQLRAIVDPYEFDEKTYRYKGKVVLDYSALPLPDANAQWPSGPPTSKEVWYLQEDLWLLRGLLESVRDTNLRAGSDANILKVPIKEITSIVLQGGNPAVLEAAASGEAGGYGGEGGGYGDAHGSGGGAPMGMPLGMPMGGGGAYGEGMGGTGAGGALDFPLEEEVGPATPVAAAGGEGEYGSDAGGYGGAHAGGSGMPGPAPGIGTMGAAANPITDLKRYVDDGDLPYKTRAFKMTVIMDHRQLPEFLVELTNSPFPVRVLRVNWAQLNEEQFYAAATGLGGGYGESMGMPGGGRGSRGGLGAAGSRGGLGSAGSRGAGGMGLGGRTSFGDTGGGMPGGSRGGLGRRPSSGLGGGLGMPRGLGAASGSRGLGGGRSPLGMPAGMGTGMRAPGGRGLGMPPMGAMGGGYGEGGGGMMGTEQADLYAQAMLDPYLAQVVIGGLMTIYRDPAEVEAAAEGTLEIEEEPVEGTGEALPAEQMPSEDAAPEENLDPSTPESAGSDAVDPATEDPNAAPAPTPDAAPATAPSADGTLPDAAPAAEEPPVAAEASDSATPVDNAATSDPNAPGAGTTEPPPQ